MQNDQQNLNADVHFHCSFYDQWPPTDRRSPSLNPLLKNHRLTGSPLLPVDCTSAGTIVYLMADSKVQRNLRAAMKEARRIQDRFIAEPLFAKTGRGYLKSEGVSTLQKIKSNLR